jgi:hypothetical protein
MSGIYTVEPIAGAEIRQALPLLYGLGSQIDCERWRAFCERRDPAADRQTVLVARTEDGYLRGLCAYTVLGHLEYGTIIEVPVFVIASAADPDGVADQLLDVLTSLSRQAACTGILISGEGLDSVLRESFAKRGAVDHESSIFIPRLR